MRHQEGRLEADDGVCLFFHQVGDGPDAVVFPNGFHLLDDFEHLAPGRTLIFYDLRNRGRSDLAGASSPARGIHDDVDDLDAVRRHFGLRRASLVGHSYVGLTVALYALRHAAHVERIVQIAPAPPNAAKEYPAHLTGVDATSADVMSRLERLRAEPASADPEERCRRFWSILSELFVADPAHAGRIRWGRCDLPNERNWMKPWTESVLPSIQALRLTREDLAPAVSPVLVVHGARDRTAPYGGARDWARMLPNARLLTIANAAHAPWLEAPDQVLGPVEEFLDGVWPEAAEVVKPAVVS